MEIEYADETIKELFLDLLNVSGSKNLLQKRIGLHTITMMTTEPLF